MGERNSTTEEQQRSRMGYSSWWLPLSVVLLALAVPLAAQTSKIYRQGNFWVEETSGTLPALRELHVGTDWGAVQVQGTSQKITYLVRKRSQAATEEAARRQFEMLRISAAKAGDVALLQGKGALSDIGKIGVDFIVQVPHDIAAVRVETRCGALVFGSLATAIVASTGGGLIKLDELSGQVRISSGGGNIVAGNVGTELAAHNTPAELPAVGSSAPSEVKITTRRAPPPVAASMIETGAGSVEIRKCMGNLMVSSGGGNLLLGDVEGAVQAETQAGSVRLASAGGPVRVSTGGGSVELYKLSRGAQVDTGAGPIFVEFLGDHGFTESFLHTSSGDVTVCLTNNVRAELHANSDMSTGGGIDSQDFTGLNITRMGGEMMPLSMSAEGPLNGGGPPLRIRTMIGHIALRRCSQ